MLPDVSQMPPDAPRCLPDAPRCFPDAPRCFQILPDAFQMPSRCLQMPPFCISKKTSVWGLTLESLVNEHHILWKKSFSDPIVAKSHKARKPTFQKWVLHDLTNMKDTQWVEFYVYTLGSSASFCLATLIQMG